jgi:hypothetical protein
MTLAAVTGTTDSRGVWKKVVEILAATREAHAHAESLQKNSCGGSVASSGGSLARLLRFSTYANGRIVGLRGQVGGHG